MTEFGDGGPILSGDRVSISPALRRGRLDLDAGGAEFAPQHRGADTLDNFLVGSHASDMSTNRAIYKHKSSLADFASARQFATMAIGERIQQARAMRGVSQAELGRRVNQAQTTISSWERGRTEPTREDVERVASALDVAIAELEATGSGERVRTVPLVGYVGAGAEAHFYASADEGLDQVVAPEGSTPHTVAAEIRGDSLGPLFASWLVFFDDIHAPVTLDQVGQLCVVGLPDGKVLVKRLRRARAEGFYHLESNTEGTLFDQEVTWAARVKTMTPR